MSSKRPFRNSDRHKLKQLVVAAYNMHPLKSETFSFHKDSSQKFMPNMNRFESSVWLFCSLVPYQVTYW
ncbi:hypothetical protein M404DRAFT_1003936 [Pisolithus tinctorius Marx 270]|uniref:Uncharacterized protein n=1 Tax=Pisolithus tinctorius Marx 270 TaxID=870435 RepID=A0A0C3NGS1_PISTI|nr:hypothetical protein M404DRAFT_1003936 [Pisolithus tinctorius Marx 270]